MLHLIFNEHKIQTYLWALILAYFKQSIYIYLYYTFSATSINYNSQILVLQFLTTGAILNIISLWEYI